MEVRLDGYVFAGLHSIGMVWSFGVAFFFQFSFACWNPRTQSWKSFRIYEKSVLILWKECVECLQSKFQSFEDKDL